nr:MAG TPA: RNA polymerase inhibitor [Caudoviricetes sp.]
MTRTYHVTFDVTANVTFEVEAHDEVEAQEIANQLNVRDLDEVNKINTCESRMEVYLCDY